MTEDEMARRIESLEREFERLHVGKRRPKMWLAAALVIALTLLTAGSVTKPYTFSSGQTISSSQVNSDLDALYGLVNGNIDSANLANDSASLGKVSAGLVTASGGNVGIGTATPAAKLDVAGTVRMTGFSLTTSPSSGYVLTSDTNGTGTWQVPAVAKGFGDAQQAYLDTTGWLGSSDTSILSVTVSVQGGQRVLIMYSCRARAGASTTDNYVDMYVTGGATTGNAGRINVGFDSEIFDQKSVSRQFLDTPGPGTVTYTLKASGHGTGSVTLDWVDLVAIVG